MLIWENIDNFLQEENYYKGQIKKKEYYAICKKYHFVEASIYWFETKETKNYPNVSNQKISEDKPDIRGFFDHHFSFKNDRGEIYWIVCPYNRGLTKKEIETAFRENNIKCNIEEGFYADYAIILKPKDLRKACYYYSILKEKDYYLVIKWTDLIASERDKSLRIGKFSTEEEAKAFIKGIKYRLTQEIME